jgi:hypothetical protein
MRRLGVVSSRWLVGTVAAVAGIGLAAIVPAAASAAVAPQKTGSLDCNGKSPIQRPARIDLACADPHDPSEPNNRFDDNGTYIGHDEPAVNFISNQPGSGGNATWTLTLPTDPPALPTVATPGSDVTHTFELSPAIWFSMALCDPNSYPQNHCTPNSDTNAPAPECLTAFPCFGFLGGGSAFMELQFYPPGFSTGISADNTHWASALTIDSAEITPNFEFINPDCEEPQNIALIQRNGHPTGPPSPQLSNLSTTLPNAETLLMNPGDTIRIHLFDAPAPGGGHALMAVETDLTTGQTGFMQASAANGFMSTNVNTCEGTRFNFEPEYSTAAPGNITPWGAGTETISSSVEIGHFEACTSLKDPFAFQFGADLFAPSWLHCAGPYEATAPGGDGPDTVEPTDAPCFEAGQTIRPIANSPDEVTGCLEEFTQNGDLDFDGSSYWPDWPTSLTPTNDPTPFLLSAPTTVDGAQYQAFQFQTDLPFSEITTCSSEHPEGCTAPPPNAPGGFYPHFTLVTAPGANGGTACTFEFGNMENGNSFGDAAQYGSFNPIGPFPDLASEFHPNTCTS